MNLYPDKKKTTMNKILQSSMMLLAGAALLASCQKDDRTVNLTAIIADQQAGNAKVYIDGVYGCWQQGDEVRLRSGSNDEATYELAVSTGAASAQITGVTEGAPYTAGYPASCVTAIADGIVTIEVPAEQSYATASAYSGAEATQRIVCPMAAYSADGGSLKFYNASALLAVTVTNTVNEDLTLYAVEVESDNAPLAGTATVGVDADADSITATDNTASKVTLTFSTSVVLDASTGQKTVYIPVLPIAMSQKSNLTVHVKATGSSGKYTFHDESSAAEGVYILQNQIGSVPCTLSSSGVTSVNPYFWGQGTEDCPYLIENYTDLDNLRKRVNAGDDEYNAIGKCYLQTSNIDVADESGISSNNWNTSSYPNIGNSLTNRFKANYDGDGHTISGLHHETRSNNPPAYEGLFAYVGGGKICRLTVSGEFYSTKQNNMGGVVGKVVDNEEFLNVTNEIKLTVCGANSSSGSSQAAYGNGGIVGYIGEDATQVSFENCHNNAVISCPNQLTINSITFNPTDYNYKLGGLVGYNETASLTISGCSNKKEISTLVKARAYGYLGGLVAYTTGPVTITSSSNSGAILSNYNSTSSRYSGGFIGYAINTTKISIGTGCVNNGEVRNKDNSASGSYCAGFIGGINTVADASITGCTNNKLIESIGGHAAGIVGHVTDQATGSTPVNMTLEVESCTNAATINGSNNCAGIVSYINKAKLDGVSISNCENTADGTVTCGASSGGILGSCTGNYGLKITNCTNSGEIIGKGIKVGGICGEFSYVNIKNCTNKKNVSSTNKHVGGIVGSCGEGTIDNCHNEGSVTLTTVTSSNDGCVGGIVGYCANTTNNATNIINCHNQGALSNSGKHTGGIVGYGNGKYMNIYNCYNTGSITASGDNGGGIIGFLYSNTTKIQIRGCYNSGLFSAKKGTFAPLVYGGNNSGTVAVTSSYAFASVLTNATYSNVNCNPTGTFTGFGTIGDVATALCTNLNSWVTTNNASASNPVCLSWEQAKTAAGVPTELPHHVAPAAKR